VQSLLRVLVMISVAAIAWPATGAARRYLGDEGPGRTFATPAILKPNVRLWTRVYGEYDSWTEIYYDTKHLDILLGTLDLQPHMGSAKKKTAALEAERHRIRAALRALARGKRRGLSKLEARLLRAYGGRLGALKGAEKRVGAHAGLRDRFGLGLQRLAKYRPYVEEVLRRHELPTALTALAMTESLFNPKAKSKAGAYGCWQFLTGTGKEYLHINPVVDERRDPIVSTDGAARMLRGNIERLKKWPLALTGYNYGPNGMARAAKETGSHDLAVILRKWSAKRFKFASRNYYASFLAALAVMRNQKKYFPTLPLPRPIRFATVPLPASAPLGGIGRHCKVPVKQLVELNPALTDAASRSRVKVPQGFPLRVPARAERACKRAFHKVAGAVRRPPDKPRKHRVRLGESLIGIASRYGTTLSTILKLNKLARPRNLRVGEHLKVPGGRRQAGFTVVPVTPPRLARRVPAAPAEGETDTATR
jgi:membrane-bound lytic murein transglycosylase D